MQTEFLITKLVPAEDEEEDKDDDYGGSWGKAHGFAFTGTHRLWTLLNVLGIGVSSHICEQCGAIQWPNVFAASDLHRVNNYYTSLSLSESLSVLVY